MTNFIILKSDFVGRYSASIILAATYGYDMDPNDDPLVKLSDQAESVIIKPGPPGASPVDLFPFRECWFYNIF